MRMNTDNPTTMPITDSVYGKKRKSVDRPERSTPERKLWHALTQQELDKLADRFRPARRFAARRRQENG